MWELIKIRADYEGWWLFDDWPEHIVETQTFSTDAAFFEAYESTIKKAKEHYCNHLVGKHNIYAFYNNCDIQYCEDCEEDLQIFYSFIVRKNKEIYLNMPLIN